MLSPVAVRFCIQGETYGCLFLHTGFAVVVQTERGTVASQHARGLTIQLSQGQGRQRLRPRVCRARTLLVPSMVVRRRQDNTPERCVSTEKWFLFICVVSVPLS